jgi:O-antigen ligase
MTLLLPIVAALSALIILPWYSFYFDVIPKIVVILAGSALVFLLPRQWPAKVAGNPAAKPLRWFTIIVAVQAIVTIVAAIVSTHPQLSWLGGTWRRSGAIAEIAVLVLAVAGAGHLAAGRTRLRTLLRITVLASIPISIYGGLQYFGIDPFLAPAGYHFGEGLFMIVRPPSTLGHAAYFATYLLYAAFSGAALVSMETERAWKVAAFAASVFAIFAIVLSGTRAAILGFILGMLFVMLRERSNWRFVAAIAVLLVAIGVFYASPAGQSLRARVLWASEDRYGGGRLLLWRDSLRMSGDRWLIGYGPEAFPIEFPRHESLELARAFPDFYHESPHNIFLDALDSKGVFGLAALVALVALGLAYARGPIGGAFLAMLVSQQFTTFTLPTELYFYLCAAIILSDFEAGRILTIRLRPGYSLLAVPLAAFAIHLATGDALLATARRAVDQHDPDRAAEFQNRARSWRMTADVYFSRRFLTQTPGDSNLRFRVWQDAISSASHAPETADDRQNALINLAAMQSGNNDAAGVERSLREAIAAAPMYFKSHWLLAQVLELEGRTEEARIEAQAAVDRDGGKHTEVMTTWERLRRR